MIDKQLTIYVNEQHTAWVKKVDPQNILRYFHIG